MIIIGVLTKNKEKQQIRLRNEAKSLIMIEKFRRRSFTFSLRLAAFRRGEEELERAIKIKKTALYYS